MSIPIRDLLTTVSVIGVACAAIGGAFLLGRRALTRIRWQRPVTFRTDPIPAHWEDILARNVVLTRTLSSADREKLLRLVQVFVSEKHIDGAGGLDVTDEMKVTIAAQACLLLLHLDGGCYPGLRTVLVYPGAYAARHPTWFKSDPEGISRPTRLGESWMFGVVVLAWDSALSGARNADDGRNVTLHEFAHQLDQEDGAADGVPILPPTAVRTWARILGDHFEVLRRDTDAGRRSALDEYGATNKAEFFAVATEAFFEKPGQLQRAYPDLYDELRRYYRQDPAESSNTMPPA